MAALPIGFRFRLVDTAGSELGVVSYQTPRVAAGETVYLPDGGPASVVEVMTTRSTAVREASKRPSSSTADRPRLHLRPRSRLRFALAVGAV
jgi:hypothetical protein